MFVVEDGVMDEMFCDELEGLVLMYYDVLLLFVDEDVIVL